MSSSEAKNLRAITEAMEKHDRGCPSPLLEVRMNPFEVERLDWNEIRGIPIKADDDLPTGRFKLVCSGQHGDAPAVEAEAQRGREVAA